MAKQDFDKEDGVWRTVGGRRIFIRNGQALSDAMKESGKFSRVARNQKLYEKVDNEKKEDNVNKQEGIKLSEKQKQAGNELHEKSLKNARDDVSQYLRGNKGDFDSDEEFVKALSEEWAIDKEEAEKLFKEGKSIENNKTAGQHMVDLIKDNNVKTFADEIKEKEINTKGKTSSEENIKVGESKSGEVDLVKVNDNIYIPKRSGETEEDAFKKFEKRQQEYRKNLQPEVMKNLRDPRRLWGQDLIDTYIEMNEAGLIQTGEPNKFTRDMKTMTGEPLYSPDREKKTSGEEKTTSQIMNNRLQLKAYQKYLKEHPNSKMTFEDFKKEK